MNFKMISFEEVSKKYKNNKNVLDKITFHIKDNEIVSLLGPNGAGKTTLIKCLTGLITHDSGSIYISNKDIKKYGDSCKKDIEIVLDGARSIYWGIKVISNFYYFGALKGKSRKYIDENIEKYDSKFKIKELLNKRVADLSLGQKQKVSILSSILVEPKILILDEPSNGLDINAKNDLIELLLYIKEMGITILLTSHDLEFTHKTCDRYILINEGKINSELINSNISLMDIEKEYFNMINGEEKK